MLDFQAIAATHQIPASDLTAAVAGREWDFSRLESDNAAHVEFAQRVIEDIATGLAKRAAAKAADRARFAAKWETPAKAAQANPARSCRRCSGVGRIITFSHVNDGICCRCEGRGVL